MKYAELSYHRTFPATPMSIWAGAKRYGWVQEKTASGQKTRPRCVAHPFLQQRKLWCLLSVNFQGIELQFAMPGELDHFMEIMSQNPLPSGRSLVPDCAIGRPNSHWLSRLPKKAKPRKFRLALCQYLSKNETANRFRHFYKDAPVKLRFEGISDTFFEAKNADPPGDHNAIAGKAPG